MQNVTTLLYQPSAAKVELMMERERSTAILEPVSSIAIDTSVPYEQRKPFLDIHKAFLHMSHESVRRKAASISVSMRRHMQQLAEAPLTNKRDVLRSMPIVTIPVAAMSLGLHPDALLTNENDCRAVFAALYIGALCYSLDDLRLIAENPHWILPRTFKAPLECQSRCSLIQDSLIFVDWEVATAYTNLALDELNKLVRKSTHPSRPYRLADLEQVRMAKLAAALN